jgi:hypothetical protein
VRLLPSLLLVAALGGCGNLTETDGVAGLDVQTPKPPNVEVGETITLQARPFNAQGETVSAPVTWTTPDKTVTLTPDGKLTGVTPQSTARIQAQAAAIISDFIVISVIYPPDTLAVTGDSILTVPAGTTTSGALKAGLFSRQSGSQQPVNGRRITYQITSPTFADPSQRTVELPGQVLTLSAQTGADGTPSVPGPPGTPGTPRQPVTLSRVGNSTTPLTVVVTITATTGAGAPVPGSGQRFTVTFQ